ISCRAGWGTLNLELPFCRPGQLHPFVRPWELFGIGSRPPRSLPCTVPSRLVNLARRGVEGVEYFLQLLPTGNGCRVFGVGGNGLLDERRVLHVEQIAALSQFPVLRTNVPFVAQLDVDPFAWVTGLSAQLRREAPAIERHVLGQFGARDFG